MYLKYFLESGIFAQDSKDSESRTLFYFVTDPSTRCVPGFLVLFLCGCMRVCVCPPPRLLITSSVMWCDIDPIRLVK